MTKGGSGGSISLSRSSAINNMGNYGKNGGELTGDQMFNMSQVLDTLIKTVQTNDDYYSIYLYLNDFSYTFTSDKYLQANDKLADNTFR
jgi:hypothetical protein